MHKNHSVFLFITIALVANQNIVLDGGQHPLIGQNMVLHNFTVIVALVTNQNIILDGDQFFIRLTS
jgi:hypothetical protein